MWFSSLDLKRARNGFQNSYHNEFIQMKLDMSQYSKLGVHEHKLFLNYILMGTYCLS